MDSSAAKMTLQGMSIQQAAVDFGNGQTLPFTPCKRGYIPIVNGQRMYACSFHDKARAKRLSKDNEVFRDGEVDLNIFWDAKEEADSEQIEDKVEEEVKKEDVKDSIGTKGRI
ncbi:unnamed protein product [Cylindrotheca closterium]|uniref:Uncharacterized protein n=1 Tax=Cylindrotheca closterium TaxID=2856 RepID=A0AAD2CNH1_9STRA|nr:unnamed protein product [Cylindrotheca closterium]